MQLRSTSLIFRKIQSASPVIDYLTAELGTRLSAGQRVLWLVPGGSAIALAVAAAGRLKSMSLRNLTVTLTDERWGEPGHVDSNWRQLMDAGFDLPGARLRPVLDGSDLQNTAAHFDQNLSTDLNNTDYTLGLFGIGSDGHTAGILPGSPAVNSQGMACGYETVNYKRITMTPAAIGRLDEAVVYAVGQNKWPVLDQLETDVSPDEQPAQTLKNVSKLIIYNDYKGEGTS